MAYEKVDGGYLHDGNGHRRDINGNYPVYPLPRWHRFEQYYRNQFGTYEDIYHYMRFFVGNYQTRYNCDITGNEIADILTAMYDKVPAVELNHLNAFIGSTFTSWDEVLESIKQSADKAQRDAFVG